MKNRIWKHYEIGERKMYTNVLKKLNKLEKKLYINKKEIINNKKRIDYI